MLFELTEISPGLPSLLNCRLCFDNLPVFIFQEIEVRSYGVSVWCWIKDQLLGRLSHFYHLKGSIDLLLW